MKLQDIGFYLPQRSPIMDVCMMNEPTSNVLEAISREIKLWGLMGHYIPTSQYVWGSSILVSQFTTY